MKRSAWRYLWTAKDIRRKLLITVGLMVIYRLAAHVPVPGADRAAIASMMAGGGAETTLLSIMNMLSGGTVSNFSVLAMGVYPYITAQIILQLLVPVVPALQARMEEDPREGVGRKTLQQRRELPPHQLRGGPSGGPGRERCRAGRFRHGRVAPGSAG